MERKSDPFWELLEPEHHKVRAFCRKLAGDRDRGDDLCQEALLAAWRRINTLRDPGCFRPWLYRIVVNRYRNAYRDSFWRRFLPLEGVNSGNGAGPDPGEHHDAKRLLGWALRRLSAEERALVTLFELEGWSLADLAALTGRPEGALKVRLFRIRRKMRDALARRLARTTENRAKTATRKERLWIVTKPGID